MKKGIKIAGILLLLGLSIPVLLGWRVFSVLSGSMSPALPVGSLLIVKPVDVDTLAVGDVITFRQTGGTVVTHRIAGIQAGKFQTKGDANAVADGGLVSPSAVIGSPVLAIPFLGYGMLWLQSPEGQISALALLILSFLPGKREKTG